MKCLFCQYNYSYFDRKTKNEEGSLHKVNERIFPVFTKIIKVSRATTLNMNISLKTPGLSISSTSCTIATFCLLEASAVLYVGGRLFGVSLDGGFHTFISV